MGFGITTGVTIGDSNGPYRGRDRRPGGPITSRFAWLIPLVIGVAFVAAGVYFVVQSMRANQWPIVSATVVDVVSNVDYDTDGRARMEYTSSLEYVVDGKSYQKRDVSTTRVTKGDTKEYKYNPSDPADTVEPGSGWFGYMFGLVGLAIAVFAAVKLITFKKEVTPAPQDAQPAMPMANSAPQPTPTYGAEPQQPVAQPSAPVIDVQQQPQQLPTQPTQPLPQQPTDTQYPRT